MDTSTLLISWAKDAPGIAGIVIIVFVFVGYLTRRDKDWRDWMASQNRMNREAYETLNRTVQNLIEFVQSHDEWERKIFTLRIKKIALKRRKRTLES